jgi:hypothetical protein
MRAFMTGSADAIAHVQEGIIVDANPAWLDLFGLKDTAAVQSQPLMDYFGSHSHAALKGALVAALHGRWSDHSLKVDALQPGGRSLPLEIELEGFEFDGEPAVRLKIATQRRDMESLAQQLEQATRLDAPTGLLHRAAFLEVAAVTGSRNRSRPDAVPSSGARQARQARARPRAAVARGDCRLRRSAAQGSAATRRRRRTCDRARLCRRSGARKRA